MFYSVTFAKAVWSQITGKSTAHQKSPFCSQHNSGAVIEQMMRSTAFGKITAVYGQIDENGLFVRKWPARKIPITDKCSKQPVLSVNLHHNGQKFTDKSPENEGLSVKCVLLTDKRLKNPCLSVNSSEISVHRPE